MPDTFLSTFPGYKAALTQSKRVFGLIIRTGRVPQHIGFIMDGNRRYARKSKMEVKEGHNAGFESMAQLLELCYECGVKAVTVYAFSIENFKRLEYEVNWLMSLAKAKFRAMCDQGEIAEEYGIRIRILGNSSLLPPDVLEVLRASEETTKYNTRATLNVCIPYTARDEMTMAMKAVVTEAQRGELQASEIMALMLDEHMYTKDSPPLDLVVRTSDTKRLSDFLLWQTVSDTGVTVEFVDCLWPEFGPLRMAWVLLKWSFTKSHGTHSKTE